MMPSMVADCAWRTVKGEDAHCTFRLPSVHGEYLVVAVMDGHGGPEAACHCKGRLHDLFLCSDDSPVAQGDHFFTERDSARPFFEAMFNELHSECTAMPWTAGTTLTVCVFDEQGTRYACANVGDSAAAHFSTTTLHTCMTTSHRLQDSPEERARVQHMLRYAADANGTPRGPLRLYPGGVSCSRSIGDKDCPAISPVPSVSVGGMMQDSVVVVASDGLWDIMPFKRISSTALMANSASRLVKRVLARATDDVTVLCVRSRSEGGEGAATRRVLPFWRPMFASSSNSSLSSEDCQDADADGGSAETEGVARGALRICVSVGGSEGRRPCTSDCNVSSVQR